MQVNREVAEMTLSAAAEAMQQANMARQSRGLIVFESIFFFTMKLGKQSKKGERRKRERERGRKKREKWIKKKKSCGNSGC